MKTKLSGQPSQTGKNISSISIQGFYPIIKKEVENICKEECNDVNNNKLRLIKGNKTMAVFQQKAAKGGRGLNKIADRPH